MANLDFYDKHNMVAYLQKSEGSEGFHQIIDFLTTSHVRYALTKSLTIYVSLIEQFWQTASASTLENGDMKITATIDGKVKVVSEASIRRHLKLEDSDRISTLPTLEIFEQLALMGSKKTAWEQFSSNIATAIICLATNRTFNFSKLIFDAMVKNLDKEAATMPYDSPLLGVHSIRSDEGSMTLNELTLIMKVKKLEHKLKSSKARRRGRLVISDDGDNQEDPSKQGRKIAQIDEDEGITLVQMSAQTQRRHKHDFVEPGFEEDYTAEPDVSTANVSVSTASAKVSTASPKVKTAAESLVYIRMSATKRKDKGKAIIKEAEPVQKNTKIARVHEEASTFNAKEWDNIQAQIESDEELAQERERYFEADKARLLVELINERKRKFAQQRAEQRRNKA
ncbi:hypothetical protein Tco_0465502 [Tanacetum coccineum]